MIDEHKASMYIVAIVGVVAAVGILVLLTAVSTGDVTGQAYVKLKAKDDAAGIGGSSVSSGIIDSSDSVVDCPNPDRPFCAICNCCVTKKTCDSY